MSKTAITSLENVAQYSNLFAIVTDIVALIHSEDANVTNAYKALVGELGNQPAEEGQEAVAHTVVSYIAAKIAEVNSAAGTLAEQVEANKDAIALLNNNAQTVGSVDYKIDQAFNTFVTKETSDNIINTFKEMVDYLKDHPTEYANLALLVGTLPEDAGVTTIVAYIEKLVNAEKERAEGAEGDLQDAIDAINNESTGILAQAKTSIQGETENTVKDVEDAMNAQSYMSAEQLAAIKALIK